MWRFGAGACGQFGGRGGSRLLFWKSRHPREKVRGVALLWTAAASRLEREGAWHAQKQEEEVVGAGGTPRLFFSRTLLMLF